MKNSLNKCWLSATCQLLLTHVTVEWRTRLMCRQPFIISPVHLKLTQQTRNDCHPSGCGCWKHRTVEEKVSIQSSYLYILLPFRWNCLRNLPFDFPCDDCTLTTQVKPLVNILRLDTFILLLLLHYREYFFVFCVCVFPLYITLVDQFTWKHSP